MRASGVYDIGNTYTTLGNFNIRNDQLFVRYLSISSHNIVIASNVCSLVQERVHVYIYLCFLDVAFDKRW